MSEVWKNKLHFDDNLDIMREHIRDMAALWGVSWGWG
jgi:hypothetical protein